MPSFDLGQRGDFMVLALPLEKASGESKNSIGKRKHVSPNCGPLGFSEFLFDPPGQMSMNF